MAIITSALPGQCISGDLQRRPTARPAQCSAASTMPSRQANFRGFLTGSTTGQPLERSGRDTLSADDAAVIGSHLAALARRVPPGPHATWTSSRATGSVKESGDLSLIDFEHARINLPARDFVRLRFRIGQRGPTCGTRFDGSDARSRKTKTNSYGTWARSTP